MSKLNRALPCQIALCLLTGSTFCPASAEDRIYKEADVTAENMFSIDDEVNPSFTNANDRSLERLLGREIQPPAIQQYRLVPSLNKVQREQVQSICEECKKQSTKIYDELKSLRRIADERQKLQRSSPGSIRAVAQNSGGISQSTARTSVADEKGAIEQPRLASPGENVSIQQATDATGVLQKQSDNKHHFRTKKQSKEGAKLPDPSIIFEQNRKNESVELAKIANPLETLLSALNAEERMKLNALSQQLIEQNRNAQEQIDFVLTEQNRTELHLMQQGKLLPDFLTGSLPAATQESGGVVTASGGVKSLKRGSNAQ